MAEKYSFTSPYTYALNNPIRFLDPDGNDIVDGVGNIIYTQKGGWVINAPTDAVRIGNALMKTRTGTQQFNKMVNANFPIQLVFASSPSGLGHSFIKLGRTKDPNTGEVKSLFVKSAIVEIYKDNINILVENLDRAETKDPENHPDQKITLDAYKEIEPTLDEAIGAVAVHESVHLTDDNNIKMEYENEKLGTSHNTEKVPHEVERQFLNELPMKPLERKKAFYE